MSTIRTYRSDIALSSTHERQRKTVTLMGILNWIELRLEKRRSRLALLEMTDDQLKDIGVSRADAYREGYTPFWK